MTLALQVEEKTKLEGEEEAALMSRQEFLRQTNEMAQRLQNWDWNSAPELGVSEHAAFCCSRIQSGLLSPAVLH